MNTHERVIAPRIVQPRSMGRIIWIALLAAGYLVVAWFAYDYGRGQAQTDACMALEQEHESDALPVGAGEPEEPDPQPQPVDQETAEAADAAPAGGRPAPEEPAAVADQPEEADEQPTVLPDGTLRIADVHIEPIGDGARFKYRFSVQHGNGASSPVFGTIWIAVNGMENGRPTRLSLKNISPERLTFVKMSFEQRQDVDSELKLPDDFVPRNLMIEVKPTDESYTGLSETFDWPAAE